MINKVVNFVKNKKFVIILFLIIIFVCASIYSYNTFVKPRINPAYKSNKEYIQKGTDSTSDSKNAELFFFYTNWCPHCKSAKPVWDKLKESTKSVNGVTINYVDVDCEKHANVAEQYKVEGYPTIKLNYNNKIIEYDAKPDINTLNQFLDQSTSS